MNKNVTIFSMFFTRQDEVYFSGVCYLFVKIYICLCLRHTKCFSQTSSRNIVIYFFFVYSIKHAHSREMISS